MGSASILAKGADRLGPLLIFCLSIYTSFGKVYRPIDFDEKVSNKFVIVFVECSLPSSENCHDGLQDKNPEFKPEVYRSELMQS